MQLQIEDEVRRGRYGGGVGDGGEKENVKGGRAEGGQPLLPK